MRAIILLGTAAIALPFVISFVAPAKRVGTAVSDRFLERSTTIPPEPATAPVPIDKDSLRAWVTAKQTASYARAYACRVMPLDFLYLLMLGGFLALGAYTLASAVAWPLALAWLPLWAWLVFPALYTLADFAEDCLIVVLMTQPSRISKSSVDALAFLRNAKIGSNILAITQIFALGLAGVFW
jgi:hypothetical protein